MSLYSRQARRRDPSASEPLHLHREDPFLPQGLPADHGLNPDILEQMREQLTGWKMKNVVIVRGGTLVWEWHEKGYDRVSPIYSCTKSILSALIGIAIGDGAIESADQPVAEYFPAGGPGEDSRWRELRLKHLLTMTPGLDWPDFDKPYKAMKKAPDWARFVREQPFAHEPGHAFTYNSGGSHLLSAILSKATGRPALDFARERLFAKMDFRRARWAGNNGVNEGGAGLYLSTRDLSKFGLLYLRGGDWFGESLVPTAWVEASTCIHHKGLAHYEPPIYGHYGYHWWVSPRELNGAFDCYFALGFGGQYLFVVPEYDLVVVIRKGLAGQKNAILSRNLLFDYVVRAIDS